MEGDPRNPRVPLLKKYDIPIENLSYEYVEKCTDIKELEKIIRILRSGEEGMYPDLQKVAEDRLKLYAPDSRVLRVQTPILTKDSLSKEEWSAVENDLLSWEEEMKAMDKSLDFEKSRIDIVGNKNLPEVRKVTPVKSNTEIKNTVNQCKPTNNSNQRIKSGDYKAWDKFDVDKELLKLEIEEEKKEEENDKKKRQLKKAVNKTEIDVDIDKDSYSTLEKHVLANQAKDRGNECFKSGDYTNALKYYEISIKLCETANAFNNRAMTYLKLKQYKDAVKDCNTVLRMEKFNVKALHRRATAYQNLPEDKNNARLALQDLNTIILLEPNNKAAQTDLQKLKKQLHIEDVGKKFRMPIHENDQVFITKSMANKLNESKKSLSMGTDFYQNVESLPLTYYGPSTSSFKCEPYSMTHRTLSGSLLSNEILCKCNSNRQMQNPLCQMCGEALCTPKPPKKSSSITQNKSDVKSKNDLKNNLLKLQSHANDSSDILDNYSNNGISLEKVHQGNRTSSVVITEIKDEETQDKKTRQPKVDLKSTNNNVKVLEKNKIKSKENYTIAEKIVSNDEKNVTCKNNATNPIKNIDRTDSNDVNDIKTIEKPAADTKVELNTFRGEDSISESKSMLKVSEHIDQKSKIEEGVKVLGEVTKSIESSINGSGDSNKNETNHSSKKSKPKKKKTKEKKEIKMKHHLDFLEPVKVVHADKYIHPTSVEPKIRKETPKELNSDIQLPSNSGYKAFVPNRKCLSFQRQDAEMNYSLKSGEKFRSNIIKSNESEISSREGNKENILEQVNGNDNKEKSNCKVEVNQKIENSAFEFLKTWEELKKSDKSYVERAQIIRCIKPNDLGKVIGIKLDSDMLSSLLECLEKHFLETDPKVVVEFLKQLPEVPRFGLIRMFLNESDKTIMKKLIETAESKGFVLEENIKNALAIS